MKKNKEKIDFYESMRAIAMFSVIIGHITSPIVRMTYGTDMSTWWIGNIITSTLHFAVPVFLLLSGATMLFKEYTLSDFYKKRFIRALLPFLFWAVAYIIYRWLILKDANQPHHLAELGPWLNNLIFKERISLHFWYMYMILAIYIFIPFLGKFLRSLSDKYVLILLALWVVLNLSIRLSSAEFLANHSFISSKAFMYFRYSGYLVLGYYLRKKAFDFKHMQLISGVIFIFTISFTIFYTYYSSVAANKLDLKMQGNLSMAGLVKTLAFYFFMSKVSLHNKALISLRNTISNYSYGIYLVHIMVIGVLFLNGIFWTMAHPLISLPIIYTLVLAISTAIIYLIRKVPGGKYIAG